jgi:hypothetical protein
MPGAEPEIWELTFDDPVDVSALDALASVVEAVAPLAPADLPLAYGGPMIDGLRGYVDVATPNALWILAPTTASAKALSRAIAENEIAVNGVAPLVFDLERKPARYR